MDIIIGCIVRGRVRRRRRGRELEKVDLSFSKKLKQMVVIQRLRRVGIH